MFLKVGLHVAFYFRRWSGVPHDRRGVHTQDLCWLEALPGVPSTTAQQQVSGVGVCQQLSSRGVVWCATSRVFQENVILKVLSNGN